MIGQYLAEKRLLENLESEGAKKILRKIEILRKSSCLAAILLPDGKIAHYCLENL